MARKVGFNFDKFFGIETKTRSGSKKKKKKGFLN